MEETDTYSGRTYALQYDDGSGKFSLVTYIDCGGNRVINVTGILDNANDRLRGSYPSGGLLERSTIPVDIGRYKSLLQSIGIEFGYIDRLDNSPG